MAATKKYEAATVDISDASYEVRLEEGVISVSNITGIILNTLYAKKGSTFVKINGVNRHLDVADDITSVEDAATAIKAILYVLNVSEGENPSSEAIQDAVSIDGTNADALTFANIEKVY